MHEIDRVSATCLEPRILDPREAAGSRVMVRRVDVAVSKIGRANTKLTLGSSSLPLRRVFRITPPTLPLRRLAEDWNRPAEFDRQTPYAERHEEARNHRGEPADA